MEFGTLNLSIISDGTARFDAGAVFGIVPKVLWSRKVRPDRRNRITFGLNCLLIQANEKNILVDTGIGPKEPQRVKNIFAFRSSRLLRELKSREVSSKDIDLVVLTHLHFDHCGGNTNIGDAKGALPTFPRAKYFVQEPCWEEATHPNERTSAAYHEDDFLPVLDAKQLELLNGNAEILPGVSVYVTNGHSKGHQVVMVKSEGKTAFFTGDLIPTESHLSIPYISAFDLFPLESMERKRELLRQAEEEKWLIVFGHGYETKAGYLERKEGRLGLKGVEVV